MQSVFVHHLVLVQKFHLSWLSLEIMAAVQREKTHKEAESYSIIASWGDCLLWTWNFHSAAPATTGHLAKSIKAVPQRQGPGQTVARLMADHQFDPEVRLLCNAYQTPVPQEL